jgi:Undecaprenyl-phosphate glucose phosphotransferase
VTDDRKPTGAGIARANGSFAMTPRMAAQTVMLLDGFVITFCAVLTHFLYEVAVRGDAIDILPKIGVGLVAAVLCNTGFRLTNTYQFDELLDLSGQIGRIAVCWTGAVLALIAVAFLMKISDNYSRMWLVTWSALTPAMLLATRSIAANVMTRLSKSDRMKRHIAIVGVGPLSERLCEALLPRTDQAGLKIIGIFDDRNSRVGDSVNGIPVKGCVEDLLAYGRNNRLDEIVIALPWSAEERVAKIVKYLSLLPCDIRLCPDLVGLRYMDSSYSRLGDFMVLDVSQRPIGEWSWIAKLVQDYVIGIAAAILTAPLLAMIALAIRLDSPGPVLFRQKRRGFNHNIITVLKFRTMTVMEDGAAVRQVTKGDDRITRVGRLLRKTSLDELPQIFNVLMGDMSIVGPRPHPLALDEQFSDLVDQYHSRHRVRPGITGWAQINGFRGETDTVDKLAKRIEYDLYYIKHWSLWMDFKIIVLTAFTGLINKNAY